MPTTSENLLTRANTILAELNELNITTVNDYKSLEDKFNHSKLIRLREHLLRDQNTINSMDVLTRLEYIFMRAIVPTELKIGACSNLASRFALEYIKKYKDLNICLISTAEHPDGEKNNHMFVLIGPAFKRLANQHIIKITTFYSISEFLSLPGEDVEGCVIADPFFNCCFSLSTESSERKKFNKACAQLKQKGVFQLEIFQGRTHWINNFDKELAKINKLTDETQEVENRYMEQIGKEAIARLNQLTAAVLDNNNQWQQMPSTKAEGEKILFFTSPYPAEINKMKELLSPQNGFSENLFKEKTIAGAFSAQQKYLLIYNIQKLILDMANYSNPTIRPVEKITPLQP